MDPYKLTLINPFPPAHRIGFGDSPVTFFPPLGLGIIAALTPDHWEVELLDENAEDIHYHEHSADLIGITVPCSSHAHHAYSLASDFKARNMPVVLGGNHASLSRQEAQHYCDALVIGEAEPVWGSVIRDFENASLKDLYNGGIGDLNDAISPRRDLFHPSYAFGSLFTSRGCPMNCEFCSVSAFNGRKYRRRQIADILDELETIEQDVIMFVDDNIVGYGRAAEEDAVALFKGMIDRGIQKKWVSQASLNFAASDQVLEYAAQSGCQMILIGIESENPVDLKNLHKTSNLGLQPEQFNRYFRRMHEHGIAVWGSFIFGLDSDTVEAMQRRAEFIARSLVDVIQISTLTPLPGTAFGERIFKGNRLRFSDFPRDWKHFDFLELVYQPRQMNVSEYYARMQQIVSQLYSRSHIWERHLQTKSRSGNSFAAKLAFGFNALFARITNCYRSLA